jgi:hypothetical protein
MRRRIARIFSQYLLKQNACVLGALVVNEEVGAHRIRLAEELDTDSVVRGLSAATLKAVSSTSVESGALN